MPLWLWMIIGFSSLLIFGWFFDMMQKRKRKRNIARVEKVLNNEEAKNPHKNMQDVTRYI